jgi:LacI family transcriptional regulator
MGEINIRLLAKELGLSISTISKALQDSHEISAETKQKVLALARLLNYTPNPYASSLRRKKSNTIAVVIPEVADSFFSQAINGIETVAIEKGYQVIINLTHENFEREKTIIRDLGNGRVDGVLMSVSSETNNFDHLNQLYASIPLVFFDRACEEIPVPGIITNDFESGYLATQHLIDNGSKKIAYLSISNGLSIINKRLEGYTKAITDSNNILLKQRVIHCPANPEETRLEIEKLLTGDERPDGIIASVERLAPPVYEVCQQQGIQIPNELKIVCFSNLATVSILNPSLTTITQPAFEMGKQAAEILFGMFKKNKPIQQKKLTVLPSDLIVRRSTQPQTATSSKNLGFSS